MPSGMTFAQRARAAELNASKRRKAAREAEDEVPELAPITLGALKFTKRNRGKGSQAKTLDELTEDPPSNAYLSQFSSSHGARSATPQHDQVREQCRRAVHATRATTPTEAALPAHPHYSPPRSDYSNDISHNILTTTQPFSNSYAQWDPEMARRASYGQYRYSTLTSTPASSHHASRQSSAMSRQSGLQGIHAGDLGVAQRPQDDNFSKAHLAPYAYPMKHGSPPERIQNPAGKENASSLGNKPDAGPIKTLYDSSMDDPFVNQAYLSAYDKGLARKPALNPRAAVRMPPAVKGTLDCTYRFPSGSDYSAQNRSGYAQVPPPSLAGQISKQPVEYAASRALNDPKAANNGHVRDPHPYTGFTAPPSKTEILMQSLENLKMDGDAPNSGRTVLYDPVTQGASRDPSARTESTGLLPTSTRTIPAAGTELPDFHQDLLKLSDPLPPMPQPEDGSVSIEDSSRVENDVTPNPPPGFHAPQSQLHDTDHSVNASLESHVLERLPTQEEKDAAIMAWFTGKDPKHVHMREILECRSVAAQDMVHTPPQQRTILAPIGSGRNGQQSFSSNRGSTARRTDCAATRTAEQQAANDIMAPVLANMHDHMLNDPKDPFTRYSQPPAWCLDTTPGGNKSLMGETEWNPPPRVGRDPRYPTTFHEGRPTYFEEIGRGSGRR
ncbi:MAG: hypothetical protein Q9217_002598 [Psora testacea]